MTLAFGVLYLLAPSYLSKSPIIVLLHLSLHLTILDLSIPACLQGLQLWKFYFFLEQIMFTPKVSTISLLLKGLSHPL
jgi:hypothetical protein